jgi:ligand-binding sensor domain-containing protein/signal transduction histidine kinase
MSKKNTAKAKLFAGGWGRLLAGLCLVTVGWGTVFLQSVQGAVQVDRSYLHRIWQFEDGLPQNTVQAMLQTKDGYLWIATQKGLARFDGISFTVFNPGNTPELKTASFTALMEARDGALWISTETAGLNILRQGKFEHYSKTNGLAGELLRSIYQRKDGSILLSSTEGLSKWDGHHFTRATDIPTVGVIRSFHEENNGNLWLVDSTRGLLLYSNQIVTAITNRTFNLDLTRSQRAFCVDHENTMWIGSTEGLFALTNGVVSKVYRKRDGLPGIVNAIFEDRDQNLWVGTYSGLYRFTAGELFVHLNADGMAFDVVNCISQDAEGNIWVGTKDGLNQLRKRTFTAFTRAQGLGDNNIMSVMERRDGTICAGTWGGGMSILKDDRVVSAINQQTHPLRNELILGLYETGDGDLWMGMDFDAGVAVLRSNRLQALGQHEGVKDPAVRVFCEDAEGVLWFAARGALYSYEKGAVRRYTKKEGVPADLIRTICRDHVGNLWFGTSAGMAIRKDGKMTAFKGADMPTNAVNAIYADASGTLWIGTLGAGVVRYRDGKASAYKTEDGLFQDDILEILEDDFEHLWMTSRFGVFRVSKKDFDALDRGEIRSLNCIFYGKHDGLVSLECSNVAKPAACKSRDGRLWFATAKGLVVVDPKTTYNTGTTPPPVYLEKILVGKEARQSINGRIELEPGKTDLEFHYTALSYSVPAKNKFRYKLEGLDEQWVNAGSRRVAYYSNLRPGEYKFRVVGSNHDGVWNETGAAVTVYLAPLFYQTAWFYSACVLFVGISGLGFHRIRIRHLHAHQRELRALVDERTKDLTTEISERKRAQAEVETVHKDLLQASRKAGMAEVASGVLHNVGNVLNSVNVSAGLIKEQVRNSRQANLRKAATMLRENSENLPHFLSTDERGRQLPDYLIKLADHVSAEQAGMLNELESLCKNVDHIKDIVAMQQNYAKVSGIVESLNIAELVEDAVRLNAAALARHDVQVLRDYQECPQVATDKHKVLQILVNLIRNAKYACDEGPEMSKRLMLTIRPTATQTIQIIVSDNGVGIPAENLTRIFSHGFTTRKSGHGFGLHSAALAAKEMSGSLTVQSDGVGKGATFILEIPLKANPTTL